jgi:HD-GYP domain-containing protein (c-di-GMP phosphodiesterase class II)
VADAFDAMTSDRPYRKAQPLSVARQTVSDNSGTQFDPEVVQAFLAIPDDVLMAEMQNSRRESRGGSGL